MSALNGLQTEVISWIQADDVMNGLSDLPRTEIDAAVGTIQQQRLQLISSALGLRILEEHHRLVDEADTAARFVTRAENLPKLTNRRSDARPSEVNTGETEFTSGFSLLLNYADDNRYVSPEQRDRFAQLKDTASEFSRRRGKKHDIVPSRVAKLLAHGQLGKTPSDKLRIVPGKTDKGFGIKAITVSPTLSIGDLMENDGVGEDIAQTILDVLRHFSSSTHTG